MRDERRGLLADGADVSMEAEVANSSALKPIKVSTPLLDKAVAMTSCHSTFAMWHFEVGSATRQARADGRHYPYPYSYP